VRCHAYFIFENYGLGLGLALFSLGIQVGPAMQKNFNLSWKFFQIFRENLGFETCFKFQFGDSLAWMTIQVSNRGRIGLGDHPGLETKFVIRVRIGLGDHPGLETETNRGRIGLGDHPGLETKFVIRVRIGLGDHPGLETETNRGRIGLGDHPGLETKFVIRV
jgi:hypothetical protein